LESWYLAGFSINNLTLMASPSLPASWSTRHRDDRNIARYIEEGEPPLQAALKGAEQIGFTIISLTFSLIAVADPLLFMAKSWGVFVPASSRTPGGLHPDIGGGVATLTP